MINDTQAFSADHYTPLFTLENGATAAQVMVMGPDDYIVSVMRYVLQIPVTDVTDMTGKLRPAFSPPSVAAL